MKADNRQGISNLNIAVGAVNSPADKKIAAVAINLSESFFASLGASVAITNATFDNKVTAEVDSSTITASNVNIQARDDHATLP